MTVTPDQANSAGSFASVGVGPGDPELVTAKAIRLISSADVVAYHRAPTKESTARTIAAEYFNDSVTEEALVYPVTTQTTDHPLGYYGALADFYTECFDRLSAHLLAGRNVVLLAEGDPMFYGSSMYVHDMLSERFDTQVVPGITSPSAASAALNSGLCRHEDVLTVLPGTLGVPELARRLADTDAAIIMKLGRTFANVREALRQAGVLERAWYVERASRTTERCVPVTDVDAASVPYMALIVVPGTDRRADVAGRALPQTAPAHTPGTGTVHVVGLGPGPQEWLSPEAQDVLGRVSHVIGYAPYVERVPQRPGLTRLPSGNTVEVDRGLQALELAAQGFEVAVVSGGDAGVFGMATAVFEARETRRGHADADGDSDAAALQGIAIHVVPGITAAHAASALSGAMLGGDHALISLSDRLKPWDVVAQRIRACAEADMAMAFYNPRSASRPHQFAQARDILLDVAGPERVVVVARHVGRPGESCTVTTLDDLDPETVDMGCLVMVGASSTRITSDARVWTPRFVR